MGKRENLIPMDKRTPEERRSLGSKGGKRSAEVRREKRDIRNAAKLFLFAETEPTDIERELLPESIKRPTQLELCVLSCVMHIRETGDVRSLAVLSELIGKTAVAQTDTNWITNYM